VQFTSSEMIIVASILSFFYFPNFVSHYKIFTSDWRVQFENMGPGAVHPRSVPLISIAEIDGTFRGCPLPDLYSADLHEYVFIILICKCYIMYISNNFIVKFLLVMWNGTWFLLSSWRSHMLIESWFIASHLYLYIKKESTTSVMYVLI